MFYSRRPTGFNVLFPVFTAADLLVLDPAKFTDSLLINEIQQGKRMQFPGSNDGK